ncbi:orexin receptor type 1-like [Mizuhopecten yessoensis]|uniref:orexin receptor type 1-like n=1 Tax=Mizuhopecten yessoensis TaxID=6573 RepID=UPI000B45D644|nr:orexin receptor type 1-like [Mizuhopecten yessoensis]
MADSNVVGKSLVLNTTSSVFNISGLPRHMLCYLWGNCTNDTRDLSFPFDRCDGAVFDSYVDYTQIPAVHTAIIVCYLLVMVFAVFGNILVIWTIWRNTHMHTVTNYYIVNLALSDFLVSSIVLPLKLLEYTSPCDWQIFSHDALCAVVYYILPIFVFASVLTLVAISLERYYAIVHPLSAMKVNSKSRTKKIIAVTWVIPIVICTPYLYCGSFAFEFRSHYGTVSRQICADRFDEIDGGTGNFRRVFFLVLAAFMYFLPMIIIITTCSRIARSLLQPIIIESSQSGARNCKRRDEVNKRKVARMVIVIAVAFILSWSPMYVVNIVSQLQGQGDSFLVHSNFLFTMLIVNLAGFINSCVNPFIYTAMSKKFRKSFGRTLGKIFCNYYCRQRLFLYRDSIIQRRSTAYTSASRGSFIDPEAEPLQSEMRERPPIKGKESHSSSSEGDSSWRSQTRLCKTAKGRQPMTQENVCGSNEGDTVEQSGICAEMPTVTSSCPSSVQITSNDYTGHGRSVTNGQIMPRQCKIRSFMEPNKNGIKTETFIMRDIKPTECDADGHVRTLTMCIGDINEAESVEIKQDACP